MQQTHQRGKNASDEGRVILKLVHCASVLVPVVLIECTYDSARMLISGM